MRWDYKLEDDREMHGPTPAELEREMEEHYNEGEEHEDSPMLVVFGDQEAEPDRCQECGHTPHPDGWEHSLRCSHYKGALYVNTYEVGRAYGGPEEGGWWYDVGTPVQSILAETREEADRLLKAAHERDEADNAERRRWGCGLDKLVTCLEDHYGCAYPERRPVYE